MAQTDRGLTRHAGRPPAYWEAFKEKLKLNKVADTLNLMLDGQEVPAQQERASLFLANKILPNLQAVALQVEEARPQTKEEIAGYLASTGLRPEQAWLALGVKQPALVGEHTREKKEPDQSLADPPTPPDAGA